MLVVQNNHHHRIADFEARLPFAVDMHHYPPSYLAEENILPGCRTLELSHHLAHAWCAVGTSPWSPLGSGSLGEEGGETTLVVVMDGMGETATSMRRGAETGDSAYVADDLAGVAGPVVVPEGPPVDRAWREGESAYVVRAAAPPAASGGPAAARAVAGAAPLVAVWKRFVEERSPAALENHGFHDMESLGALYSRISSAIFGDWNACGKVMGLAPWASAWSARFPEAAAAFAAACARGSGGTGEPPPLLRGSLIRR